jgi:hypothetical protein
MLKSHEKKNFSLIFFVFALVPSHVHSHKKEMTRLLLVAPAVMSDASPGKRGLHTHETEFMLSHYA